MLFSILRWESMEKTARQDSGHSGKNLKFAIEAFTGIAEICCMSVEIEK